MEIKPYLDKPDDELMDLLLLADPNRSQVLAYVQSSETQISEMLVAYLNDEKVGVVVLTKLADKFEIKNIAVKPKHQNKGIGKALVENIKIKARELDAKFLSVGTGNSSIDQLVFYQHCGFRIASVLPNYFINYEPFIYENGIRCIDMILLRFDL